MKKLLTIISILMFSSMLFGKKHINPNGHPFTLNVECFIEPDWGSIGYSANMPLTSWLTIKGGSYPYRINEASLSSSGNYILNSQNTWNELYIGGEVHIPIYKLWDKN